MKLGGFSLALVAGGVLALVVGASQQTTAGATPDVDSDLVFNVKDNCINKENALNAQGVQADSDRDGFGNQCDGDFTGPVVISGVPVPASDCATVSPTSDPGGGCAGNGVTNIQDFLFFSSRFGEAYDGGANPNYASRADMNINGVINVQDFLLFSQNYQVGAPGPSGVGCALTAPGSDNLTQRRPCEAIRTHRTKCSGIPPQTFTGLLKNDLTGDDLRFINAPKVVASILGGNTYNDIAGKDGGHCVF